MNCEQHGIEMSVNGNGRQYCRECVISRAIAQQTCGGGHPRTRDNIKIHDSKHTRVRCRMCDRQAKRRYESAKPKAQNCPRCGGIYRLTAGGHRYCSKCQSDNGRLGGVTPAKARRELREWFDWVVVQRVLASGQPAPGRSLTQAEWFAVLDRIGDLPAAELAQRGRSTPRTVQRMRRLYDDQKAEAA